MRSHQETLMERYCPKRQIFRKVKDDEELLLETGSNSEM